MMACDYVDHSSGPGFVRKNAEAMLPRPRGYPYHLGRGHRREWGPGE